MKFHLDNNIVETIEPTPTRWERGAEGWIYFEDDEQVQSGWKEIKGEWYYFENGVAIQERLIEWENHKYYLETNCDMITCWVFIDGDWYYFRPEEDEHPKGSMVTGSYTIDGKEYNFDSDGKLMHEEG